MVHLVAGFREFAQTVEHLGEVDLDCGDPVMPRGKAWLVRREGLAEQVAGFREFARLPTQRRATAAAEPGGAQVAPSLD
jgi:hypothetical protein